MIFESIVAQVKFHFLLNLLRVLLIYRGILHFVKDNYFRTSSTSSEDEYDSDDSGRKPENVPAPTSNNINKNPPIGTSLAHTANVATAVVAANAVTSIGSGNNGNKLVNYYDVLSEYTLDEFDPFYSLMIRKFYSKSAAFKK